MRDDAPHRGHDDGDDTSGRGRWRRRLAIGVAAVLALVAFVYLVSGDNKPKRKKAPEPVAIKLLPPPPPPPPPPPTPPVETPKLKQEVVQVAPLERVEPKASAPEPPGPAALDAQGEGPADGFGLAGKPGGAAFGGGGDGTGSGGGGSKFGTYAALIQSHIQQQLQKKKSLQSARYRLGVQIWMKADGEPERVELIGSTGSSDTDRNLRDALLKMARVPQTPPSDLPQPVVLQVSSS